MSSEMMAAPLSREEVKRVIEGRGAAKRIPMAVHQWIDTTRFGGRKPLYDAVLARYPNDVLTIPFDIPEVFEERADDPSYRWLNYDNPFPENTPLDAISAIDDWGRNSSEDGLGTSILPI